MHLPKALALAKEFSAAALRDARFQQQLTNFYLSRELFTFRLLQDKAPSPRCSMGGATGGATLSYSFVGSSIPKVLLEHIVVGFPVARVNSETMITLLFGHGRRVPTRSVLRVSATNPNMPAVSPVDVTETVSVAHWGEMAGSKDDEWTLCFFKFDRKKSMRTEDEKEADVAEITIYGKRWAAE